MVPYASEFARLPPSQMISSMETLSNSAYLFQPNTSRLSDAAQSSIPATASPKLVLIIGWMGAQDGPLTKYVRCHQSLFPNSAILLLKASIAAVNVDRIGRRTVEAVLDSLDNILTEDRSLKSALQTSKPLLLIHVLSSGGSCMLHHLYDAYRATRNAEFPLHTTIFDSFPVVFTHKRNVHAVLLGLPRGAAVRALALPVAHALATIRWVQIHILGKSNILAVCAQSHNDAAKVAREVGRLYLYSDADRLVPLKAVEKHAEEAERKGLAVGRVRFRGSEHVAHAKADPVRYWSAVRDAWREGSQRGQRSLCRL